MPLRSRLVVSAMLLVGATVAFDTSGALASSPVRALGVSDCAWVQLDLADRDGHCAIYDPVRHRMVVFGGNDGNGPHHFFNDVWALSLGATTTWTALTSAGTPPNGLAFMSAIYDPVRDRMLVFGGAEWVKVSPNYHDQRPTNDVWALSLAGTPTWTKLTPLGTPPSPRGQHSAIYDPLRDRMVVFGGADDSGYQNDGWVLSLAGTPTWTAWNAAGTRPTARGLHSAIYDPVRDRMVVFGGFDVSQGGMSRDVWELPLSGPPSWNELLPTGTLPPPRYAHSAIYDVMGDRMVVTGGMYPEIDDSWVLSLSGTPAWTALVTSGPSPGPRALHSAIHDPTGERMVVFGGAGGEGYYTDVWTLSLTGTEAWTLLLPDVPSLPGRRVRSAIHDPARDRVLTFGGQDASGAYHNDVWAFPLSGQWPWAELIPIGTSPSPRSAPSIIYDPVRERLVLFGGSHYPTTYYDVWALELAGSPAWHALTPEGTPPSTLSGHKSVYDPVGDRMIVIGGSPSPPGMLDHIWSLSLSGTPAWSELSPTNAPPPPRMFASAIYDPLRVRVLLFGGWDGSVMKNDLWSLSLAGAPTWTQLFPTHAPPTPRYAHSAVYDPIRDRMVVFGGYSSNEVWALTLGGNYEWNLLNPLGEPPVWRAFAPATYDPLRDAMVVLGGITASEQLLTDTWTLLLSGVTGRLDVSELRSAAGDLHLGPNPMHGTATLSLTVPRTGLVRLGVYDLQGRLVRELVNEERHAGSGRVIWDGTNLAGARVEAGLYFVQLVAPGIHETRRIVLLP